MIPTILLQAATASAVLMDGMPDILKAYLIICVILLPFNIIVQTVFLLRLAKGRGADSVLQPSDLSGLAASLLPGLAGAVEEWRRNNGPASPGADGPKAGGPDSGAGGDVAAAGGGEPQETEGTESPARAVPSRKKTIYEENAEAGIVNILLRTGDVYRCFMSEKNRGDSGQQDWKLDYPFIGRLSQNGRFEALRAGTTYIQGGDGNDIYYMEITPRHSHWPYSVQMSNITNRAIADEIRTQQGTGSIVSDDAAGTLTVTAGGATSTYRFDRAGRADLVLLRLADTEETTREIEEGLADYMELTVQKGRSTYWHHRTTGRPGTPYADSVDTVAFVKHTARGVLYLGIGRCWRPGAGSGEIRTNTDMLETTFGGLMDPADVPQFIGRRDAARRAAPPTAVTAGGQEAADGGETGEPAAGRKKGKRRQAGPEKPKKEKKGRKKEEQTADGDDPSGIFPDDGMRGEIDNYEEEA